MFCSIALSHTVVPEIILKCLSSAMVVFGLLSERDLTCPDVVAAAIWLFGDSLPDDFVEQEQVERRSSLSSLSPSSIWSRWSSEKMDSFDSLFMSIRS